MPVKSTNRLTSFMTGIELYRVVASADGAVNPVAPPAVPTIDASKSPKGLNELVLFVTPTAGDSPTLQVWVIVDGSWYFVNQSPIGAAGRPERWVIKDLPACRWAVIVTASTGAVSISYAKSE